MFVRALPCLLLVATACGVSEADVEGADDGIPSSSGYALSVSSADAAELLAFVNDAATTQGTLDNDVSLDTRAAAAIMKHKNGSDARAGTADDDLFGDLGELDLVSYVGDAALAKLLAWALAHPAAKGETVEGVTFTAIEVSAVVWGVNQSTSDELDDGLMLETRAASGLLSRKPYSNIAQMGAVPYVGTTALNLLRTNAATWAAKRSGSTNPPPPATLAGTFDGVAFDEATAKAAVKLGNTATLQQLLDAGLPIAGAAPIVGNRPYVSMTQIAAVSGVGAATMRALHAMAAAKVPVVPSVSEGGDCDAQARLCLQGLVCSGLTVSPTGFCRPQWMANTFRSGTMIVIPDANAGGAEMGITVTGLSTVPEDVIVHLEIDHPRKEDLRIVLTQPSSAQSLVWPVGSSGSARVVMGGDVERDSAVNGVWMLKIVDTVTGNAGTLNGWSLELTSRPD